MSTDRRAPQTPAAPAERLLRVAGACGLLGTLVMAAGMVAAMLPYRGRIGERYSPVNHFVSELGEVSVNPGAPWFNTALVVGGVCMALFMGALACSRPPPHPAVRASAALGALTGLLASGVGLVPMDDLRPHLWVALAFFAAAVATTTAFTAITWRHPQLPRPLLVLELLALAGFGVVLLSVPLNPIDPSDPPLDERRPDVWLLPLAEWIGAAATLGWVGVLGGLLAWRGSGPLQRRNRRPRGG